MTRARTVLLCLAAGGCIALALPPWGWWPLAFVGFALFGELLAVPRRRDRFTRGWLVGVAWLLPSTAWMIDLSPPGWVAAGAILSFYVAVAAAFVPSSRSMRWLALPAAVAVAEFVRTTAPFGGVPLSTVAMTQARSPLLPVARVGGGVLLTVVTVAGGMALAALVRRRWPATALGACLVVGTLVLAGVAPRGHDVGSLDVALVQGGGPQRTRAVDTDASLVFQRHLVASAQVTGAVDLVLWPENVVSVDGPFASSAERADLAALARRLGAPVIPGIVEAYPDRFYNASVVLTPQNQLLDRYDKVRRVPFGEYVPFRGVLDAISGGMVSRFVPNDAVAGTGPAVLRTPSGPAGIAISWEIFFERRARDGIRHGGEILMNPTNGSSYWLTIVQSQQVASSRLRAVETGRWVLQAAPTGFSAVVSPSGAVLQRSGIREAKVLQATIERRQGLTWSVRFGPWPGLAAAVVVLIAANVVARRRDRQAGPAMRPARPTPTETPVTV